ncbi:MAG: hypothetical protein KatS3mg103_0544 [Phycisphaerales bacterium]|nr:MAG: hypothetical protein KatS3mg103_0544 [Phycisphaerales bacterium]
MPKLKIILTFAVAALFVIVLLVYATTFTVRFTEAAVVTQFGKVREQIAEPGLRFKWFYPIQGVTKYDTTNRLSKAKIETYQTRDDRQLIVGAFAIWRVKPDQVGTFYRRFSNSGPRAADHYKAAATLVEDTLRSSMSALSAYSMSELFTPDESASKLEELEARVLAQMKQTLEGQGERAFGIEIVTAGIARTSLPQTTSEAALERMRQDRARIVTGLQQRGESEAQQIRSTAEANAAKIRAFAEARARQIRARGDEEAARYLAQMTEVPGLAIFLKNLELLEDAMFSRATLLFSTDTPGLNLLDPSLRVDVQGGQIPGTDAFLGRQASPPMRSASPGRPSLPRVPSRRATRRTQAMRDPKERPDQPDRSERPAGANSPEPSGPSERSGQADRAEEGSLESILPALGEHEEPSASRHASVRLRDGSAGGEQAIDDMHAANESLAAAFRLMYRVLQLAIVGLVVIYVLSGINSVGAGEAGIKVVFGRPSAETVPPGDHLESAVSLGSSRACADGPADGDARGRVLVLRARQRPEQVAGGACPRAEPVAGPRARQEPDHQRPEPGAHAVDGGLQA